METRLDEREGPVTRGLCGMHLTQMHANSPLGQAFARDISGLREVGVNGLSAWNGGQILGIVH